MLNCTPLLNNRHNIKHKQSDHVTQYVGKVRRHAAPTYEKKSLFVGERAGRTDGYNVFDSTASHGWKS